MRCFLVTMLAAVSVNAAAFSNNTLTVCVEEALASHAGRASAIENLQQAGRRLGLTVNVAVMPWRRCLLSADKGLVDAAAFTAYVGDNIPRFAFPMSGDKADPARSMRHSKIMLYRRAGASQDFDGVQLSPPHAVVGVRRGVLATQLQVRKVGGELDEGSEDFEVILRKLQLQRTDLAALSEGEADRLIVERFSGQIEKLPLPLFDQYTYLAFNRDAYRRDSALVERLWDELGKTPRK